MYLPPSAITRSPGDETSSCRKTEVKQNLKCSPLPRFRLNLYLADNLWTWQRIKVTYILDKWLTRHTTELYNNSLPFPPPPTAVTHGVSSINLEKYRKNVIICSTKRWKYYIISVLKGAINRCLLYLYVIFKHCWCWFIFWIFYIPVKILTQKNTS